MERQEEIYGLAREKLQCAFSEVNQIVSHMNPKVRELIPEEYLEMIKSEMDMSWTGDFDFTLKISEMNMLPQTKWLMGMIYLDLWCEEAEREQITNLRMKESYLREVVFPWFEKDGLTPEEREKATSRNVFILGLQRLNEKDRELMIFKYGIEDGIPKSYDETAKKFRMERKIVIQKVHNSLWRMTKTHCTRKRRLKDYLD